MTSCTSYLRQYLILSVVITSSSIQTFAQNPDIKPKTIPPVPAASSRLVTTADETFVLDIDERRFVKENFEVGTAVETGSATSQINVRVGVSLNAGRIEVLLRNVQGNVRFRGGLERILEIIEKRSTTPGAEVR